MARALAPSRMAVATWLGRALERQMRSPQQPGAGDSTAPLLFALAAFSALLMLVLLSMPAPMPDAQMCPAAASRSMAARP